MKSVKLLLLISLMAFAIGGNSLHANNPDISGLSEAQAKSIISLLSSFRASTEITDNVNTIFDKGMVATSNTSNLLEAQAKSIISLLSAFGANEIIIDAVSNVLFGLPNTVRYTIPTISISNGGGVLAPGGSLYSFTVINPSSSMLTFNKFTFGLIMEGGVSGGWTLYGDGKAFNKPVDDLDGDGDLFNLPNEGQEQELELISDPVSEARFVHPNSSKTYTLRVNYVLDLPSIGELVTLTLLTDHALPQTGDNLRTVGEIEAGPEDANNIIWSPNSHSPLLSQVDDTDWTNGHGIPFDSTPQTWVRNEIDDLPVSELPTMTILSPNGGETFTAGQEIEVRWDAPDLPENGKVVIAFVDGYARNTYIGDNFANDGVEVITIPRHLVWGKYKIRIFCNDGLSEVSCSLTDFSDKPFIVRALPDFITLTEVSIGDRLGGDSVDIRWSSNFIGDINLVSENGTMLHSTPYLFSSDEGVRDARYESNLSSVHVKTGQRVMLCTSDGSTCSNIITVTSNNEVPTVTIPTVGSYTVKEDTSLIYREVQAGTEDAILSRFIFEASDDEGITIPQIALKFGEESLNLSSLLVDGEVTLWTGNLKIGSARFGRTNPNFVVSYLDYPFPLNKGSLVEITVKGSLTDYNPLPDSSDTLLVVNYNGEQSGLNGNHGIGVQSGAIIPDSTGKEIRTNGISVLHPIPEVVIEPEPEEIATPEPAPLIGALKKGALKIEFINNGIFHLTLTTASNRKYRVQSTCNLQDWDTVFTLHSGSGASEMSVLIDSKDLPGKCQMFRAFVLTE